MNETNSALFYRGKPLESMTQQELIDAVVQIHSMLPTEHEKELMRYARIEKIKKQNAEDFCKTCGSNDCRKIINFLAIVGSFFLFAIIVATLKGF